MTVVKFLSREKLAEYLDEELRVFLNAKEIYEINQYGWLVDGSPDPEYMGLAMWQIEPPVTCVSPSIGTPHGLSLISQPEMGRTFKKGVEFKELMKSARHSIGLTYIYNKGNDEIYDSLGFHVSDTVMKLDMATDRLRDLFVNAFSKFSGFGCGVQEFSGEYTRTEQFRIFCNPFFQTRDKLAEKPGCYEQLVNCVEELLPLVEQTYASRVEGYYRSTGDLLVEDDSLIKDDVLAKRSEYQDPGNHVKKKGAILDGISEWYKLLIETSNQVFLAEYLLRNLDENPRVSSVALNKQAK